MNQSSDNDRRIITADDLQMANNMASELYWNKKDADACHKLLMEAVKDVREMQNGGVQINESIRSQYKALLYNVASYGWLGWDEPELDISPEFQKDAIACAKEHFEIAMSLNLAPIKQSRAHWILGAVLIQDGKLESAREHFLNAAKLAEEDGQQGEAMNSQAFALVCDVLLNKPDSKEKLEKYIEVMKADGTAADFATQAPTALRVFGDRID